jgi:cell division protein FtsN
MRDLDQLRERDSEERGRRIGTFLMFAVVTIALVSAVAVVIGQTLQPRAAEPDALDQLDRVVDAAPKQADVQAATDAPTKLAALDARELSFERDLGEAEERPEVLAALEAAAREAEELEAAAAANKPAATAEAAAAEDVDVPGASLQVPDDTFELWPDKRGRHALPAGMSASGSNQKLAKAAQHDKLVAASLQGPIKAPLARAGSDGEYTLQVISFEAASAAQAFATQLRARGHEAYVATADVEGRGRTYRVRIGPFKTKAQADAYRDEFDAQEHMNTIVIKR